MLLIKRSDSDILIKDDRIDRVSNNISVTEDTQIVDASGLIVAPGLVDIHVHFREPGFEYKEDIMSGAAAAAAGGVTTCCCMPNTKPVIDTAGVVNYVFERAMHAPINVLPIGAVTIGQRGEQLTDFAALKKAGVVALSDDGIPIRNDDIMREALLLADANDMLIISHCEEEEPMVIRDVKLAAETSARVHIAHVSTASAVETIRRAKAEGVKVTAETCPHYFSLTDAVVARKGTDAKMSPPLRTERDVEAIIEGLCDGTIDAIATDHAPHSCAEKALPFDEAPNGIIGLETMLSVTLTHLYHTGILSLERIVELMSAEPARLLGLNLGLIEAGGAADIIIFDPDEEYMIEPDLFFSKARNTPYGGMMLKGKIKMTICNGNFVFKDESFM